MTCTADGHWGLREQVTRHTLIHQVESFCRLVFVNARERVVLYKLLVVRGLCAMIW